MTVCLSDAWLMVFDGVPATLPLSSTGCQVTIFNKSAPFIGVRDGDRQDGADERDPHGRILLDSAPGATYKASWGDAKRVEVMMSTSHEPGTTGRRNDAQPDLAGRLFCQIDRAEFQEVAAAILSSSTEELSEEHRRSLEKVVAAKPKFGYWAANEAEYGGEYLLAMELGRLQVFKGNVIADRDQYDLARRLGRSHPDLVALNLSDYRRQFRVFLSPRAAAMRRFALTEMAGKGKGERPPAAQEEHPYASI
jgi:hypothetical protein